MMQESKSGKEKNKNADAIQAIGNGDNAATKVAKLDKYYKACRKDPVTRLVTDFRLKKLKDEKGNTVAMAILLDSQDCFKDSKVSKTVIQKLTKTELHKLETQYANDLTQRFASKQLIPCNEPKSKKTLFGATKESEEVKKMAEKLRQSK